MGTPYRRISGKNRSVLITNSYHIADVDEGAYYGKVDEDGNWYIIKEDSGNFKYCFGTSDYSTNWTGRAALTYTYYDGS